MLPLSRGVNRESTPPQARPTPCTCRQLAQQYLQSQHEPLNAAALSLINPAGQPKKPPTNTIVPHVGDGVPPQKQTACALLARMHELHAAGPTKHGHDCAFASALGPFASGVLLDDTEVPDAPAANENKNEGDALEAQRVVPGAGSPPLPRLAQALLALDACFHRSCKTHGFVASYCQWRSEVRCAPPRGALYPLSCSIAPIPLPPPPARIL